MIGRGRRCINSLSVCVSQKGRQQVAVAYRFTNTLFECHHSFVPSSTMPRRNSHITPAAFHTSPRTDQSAPLVSADIVAYYLITPPKPSDTTSTWAGRGNYLQWHIGGPQHPYRAGPIRAGPHIPGDLFPSTSWFQSHPVAFLLRAALIPTSRLCHLRRYLVLSPRPQRRLTPHQRNSTKGKSKSLSVNTRAPLREYMNVYLLPSPVCTDIFTLAEWGSVSSG